MDVSTVAQTIVRAQAIANGAQGWIDSGDKGSTNKSAIDDYRKAASEAETAAMAAQTVTGLLQIQVPSTAGYAAAVDSLVQSASASDSDAGNATDKATARSAAVAGVTAANNAISYAIQSQKAFQQPPRILIGAFAATAILIGGAIWGMLRYLKPKQNPFGWTLQEWTELLYDIAERENLPKFGRKYWIGPIASIAVQQGISRAIFDNELLKANRSGLVRLSRADLTSAFPFTLVQQSEVKYLHAEFHFVEFPPFGK